MGEDLNKLALVHISLGFQFYLLAFGFAGYRLSFSGLAYESEDDAIQAFSILGFVVYTTAWILTLLINFGDLKGNKNAVIATLILAYSAVTCILIAISVYGSVVTSVNSYHMFTHCMGLILGLIGAIFLTLPFMGVSSL